MKSKKNIDIQMASSMTHRGIEIGMIVLFLLLISGLAWFNISQFERTARVRNAEMLRSMLQSTYNSINLWTDSQIRNAQAMASEQDVIEATEALLKLPRNKEALLASPVMEQLRDSLRSELEAMGYQGFFIIAPDFVSIASMRDTNVGSENLIAAQRREILDAIFEGEARIVPAITSDVPISRTHGRVLRREPTMFVAAPIRDRHGRIIAAYTIRVDPVQSFSDIMSTSRFGSTGETYAFDRDGWLITESRFEEQLKLSGILLSDQVSLLNIRITDPGGNLLEGYHPDVPPEKRPLTVMAASATQGLYGINVDGYRDYRGVEVFGVWSWDDSLGFGMATEVDKEEVMRPFYASRNIQLYSFGLTALLGILMTAYLSRVRNSVSHRLEEAQGTLERRIEERTSELVAINERMHGEIVERVRTEEKLLHLQNDLKEANEKLRQLASLDGLTGIPNRRIFNETLEREWKRCIRDGSPISLIMMDIDYFKIYNDTYGHQAGDACLKAVGAVLKDSNFARRPGDLVARYGGEEFAVILSNAAGAHAAEVAQNITKAIGKLAIPHEGSKVEDMKTVTISLGIATMQPVHGEQQTALVEHSDKALYKAKQCGRNRFVVYTEDFDEEDC